MMNSHDDKHQNGFRGDKCHEKTDIKFTLGIASDNVLLFLPLNGF